MTISKLSLRDSIGRPIHRASAAELVPGGGGGGPSEFESIYSWRFNGGTKYATVADTDFTGFTPDDAFSISVWFKPLSTSGTKPLYNKLSASNLGWACYHRYTTKMLFSLLATTSGSTDVYGDTDITVIDWYHIVTTYDGSRTKAGMDIYLDGASDVTTGGAGSDTIVGGFDNSAGSFRLAYNGSVYSNVHMVHLSVWDKELSLAEVGQIYNSGAPADLRDLSFYDTNCIGWFPLGNMGDAYPTSINQINEANSLMMHNMSVEDIIIDAP